MRLPCPRTGERGAAVVDFVLVLLVLLPLVIGILQLALVLHVRNTLASAAAEGARLAVQHLEAGKGNVLGMVLSGLHAGPGWNAEAPPSDAEPPQALLALPAPRQG